MIARIFLIVPVVVLAGCASPSVWERSLERGPDLSPALSAASAPVATVRRVSWERVEIALRELEAQAAASDVHPDEWSDDKKNAARATLLRGLQVSQPVSAVQILGRSQFKTTDPIQESDAQLQATARKLGANLVVYSTRVLGKADRIVQQPVSSNTWGTGWRRDRDNDYRPDSYSETTTTWIPVRISADETGGIAYYLNVLN